MHHADVYRLERMGEVADLGLDELVDDEHAIVLVEWGDVVASGLGGDLMTVRLEPVPADPGPPGAHHPSTVSGPRSVEPSAVAGDAVGPLVQMKKVAQSC